MQLPYFQPGEVGGWGVDNARATPQFCLFKGFNSNFPMSILDLFLMGPTLRLFAVGYQRFSSAQGLASHTDGYSGIDHGGE